MTSNYGVSKFHAFKCWMIAVILTGYCLGQDDAEEYGISINQQLVDFWAKTLGDRLFSTSSTYSGIKFLRQKYNASERKSELNIRVRSGKELLDDVNADFTSFLGKKIEAVDNIVEAAENEYEHYNYSTEVQSTYLLAHNKSSLDLLDVNTDPHFNYEKVVYSDSTIHVPTVIYQEDQKLLWDIDATSVLDKVFIQNAKKDSSLTWQYFGSTKGYMRNYPGTIWKLQRDEEGIPLNLYDCRRRHWYSQAIASPKIILFLVDVSGSQTGLANSMSRLMINTTIDSLDENDFFNIVTFHDKANVIDECYEDTLLSATYANKEYMKRFLQTVKPSNKSNICIAFTAAFDALAKMRGKLDKECSESIMLFTDGIEFTCQDVFKERNANGSVRVFTYLLGESVMHAHILQNIACNNHGIYSRLSVRSDVPEKVALYLPVLGRPLVQNGTRPIVWTNTYRDYQTRELTISVSQPVFNKTELGTKQGDMLGVASVDVPLSSLQRLASPYKFGVNGYFFIITNNGYITHHPRLRYTFNRREVEGISTRDITDIEQSIEQLRTDMINRESGLMNMTVEIPFDNMKRFYELVPNYYFAPVANTTYSLAVVLGKDGEKFIDPPNLIRKNGDNGFETDHKSRLNSAITALEHTSNLSLAEWIPCERLSGNDPAKLSNEEIVVKFLQEIVDGGENLTVNCDLDWTNLLLLDLDITSDYASEVPSNFHPDVRSSFVATTSGLNRECYYSRDNNERFTLSHPNTLTEDYFTRAVNDDVKGDEGFIYSIPLKGDDEININRDETLMTAYSTVKLSNKVVAIAGHQMTLGYLLDTFSNVTSMAMSECNPNENGFDPNQCNYTCDSQGITCFLMDRDGYIMASKNEKAIGSHLATEEPIIFEHLLKYYYFSSFNYIDYQSFCKVDRSVNNTNSGWSLLNPLSQVTNLMMGLTQRAILLMMTFNWYDWLFASAIPQKVNPKLFEPCELNYTYYKLNNTQLGLENSIVMPTPSCCTDGCNFSYHMYPVPKTSLVLLVIASQGCDTCKCSQTYSLEARKVVYNVSDEECIYKGLWQPIHRRAPDYCAVSTLSDKLNEVQCSASFLQPSWILLVLVTFHFSGSFCFV